MAVTDPVDARLLAALADVGKVAVHELAATVGMDPRDVAYRLVNLSANGLPLLVGVESDPNGLRAALAPPTTAPPAHSGPHPMQGTPGGPYPGQGGPGSAYPAHGTPSGAYPVQGPLLSAPSSPPAPQRPHPPGVPQPGLPTGQQPGPQPPTGPHGHAVPRVPRQARTAPADTVMSTWGPPQSALWARGDQPPAQATTTSAARTGGIGAVLETEGLEGEQLAVQLLEVQDPADYLFAAAGYRLDGGERAVVVHTEITNRGSVPFASLPDNYLELLSTDGTPIAKAPVSLTSRPPHKIGVRPGETSGGHTVYVLDEATRITAVRWSPRPEPDERSLTWIIDD